MFRFGRTVVIKQRGCLGTLLMPFVYIVSFMMVISIIMALGIYVGIPVGIVLLIIFIVKKAKEKKIEDDNVTSNNVPTSRQEIRRVKHVEACPTCGNELKESKTGEHLLCHTCRKKFKKELFQTEDDYEEFV